MKNYLKMSSACLLMALWPCAWAQHNPLGGFAYGDKEAPTGKEWESVEELALNKEYPRAYFFSFDNEAQAAQVRPEKSPYWLSLNGQWRFHWCKTPDERPKNFYKTNYDASSWDMTPVPSNWNVQGIQKDGKLKYGLPIYVNQPVIFYHERKVDDWRQGVMRTPPQTWTTYEYRNEVGSYIRYFEVPREWKGREVYIDFDGVDSFFYLWINGKYVGFSKNSRNAASFNISKYLKSGQNKLAVEVYRNSDGSFLESQDMFRLPGIFRTVALRSTPKVQIRNLNVLTDTDNLSDWQLKVTAEVRNLGKKEAKDYRLQYAVYKNILYKDDAQKVDALQATTEVQAVAPNAIEKVSAAIDVKQPDMWSAEAPNRYVLVAQLVDKKGKVIEAASTYFGFRKVEIKETKAEDDSFGNAGRYFYVNGKPIKLKGVNRHETHPEQGHVVTHAQMEEEVMLMKRANINHVRCSHYPPDPYWFYLSDKYGIYLEDEANIESHEYYYGKESLSHPKEWEKAHTARVVEMVEAAYNSPSIVIWSLGNEAGPGQNFVTAYNHLKTLDTSRPVQYERNNDIVDMGSNQYPSVAWVKGAATGKYDIKYPFHISEYAHSMGNAVGNLADYWEAIESTNYICGGAIWDWVDQALTNYTPDGKPYAAYGGDFGDFPNDGQFVMNGIIFADRTVKPQYYEVQKVYQNIKVKKLSFDTFQITNKSYFEPMEGYEGVWKLYRNGDLVEERSFDVSPLKPQKKGVVTIAPKRMDSKSEYIVVIEFRQAADKPWAKQGFVQAREQFIIQEAGQKPAIATVAEGSALELSPDQKMIVGKDFSVMFDFDKGTIETLKYGNNTIIENSGLALNAFRAFTNNDRWAYQQWFAKGLHNLQHKALAKSVKANADGSYSYSFTVQSQAPNAAKIEGGTASGRNKIVELTDRAFTDADFRFVTNQVFTVYPDGSIEVQASIASNDDFVNLPQLGYLVTMPKTYFRFTYYGRGKQDNYPDRKTGAFLGIYESDVLKEAGNFPKPQDVGHHQDSRWASLTNMRGAGAIFVGTQPMDVAALPYTAQEMTLAGHPFELPNPSATYLQLNIATTGVGGNSCGPTPLQRDRVMATQHRFGFIIRPAQAKLAEAANVSASTEAPAFVAGLINRSTIPMKVIFASSEEVGAGNATHLVDGNPNTIWHSAYSVTVAKHPHWVDFDLSKEVSFKGISYLPRTDEAGNGDVKDFSISVSDDAKTWKEVHKGSFSQNRGTPQQVLFKSPVKARYVRFTALSEQYGQDFASGAEFGLIAE